MSYIVEKMEDQLMDAISDADGWVTRNPVYAGFFDSNKEMRAHHIEPAAFGRIKSPEWKHVASFPSTLGDAMNLIENGGFIKDKRKFYAWLDRNPEYCVYDRKRGRMR